MCTGKSYEDPLRKEFKKKYVSRKRKIQKKKKRQNEKKE